jgi:hypothetical protein
MPLTVLTGIKIPADDSLSNGVDCTGGDLVRITMPAGWSGGNLTFQISSDGAGYNNLVDRNGAEITMAVVPGSAVVLRGAGEEWTKALAFVKVRSGTSSHPVKQEAEREFAFAVETP